MRTTRSLTAALLLVSLAACGDDDDDVGTGAADGAVVDGTPGGAEGGLFIEVAYVGGFVPIDFQFRNLPVAAVYEDGTVVVPGAVAAIYPGPAVTPLFTGQLDDGALDDLLAAAAEAGMVGATPDVGDASALPVADAASTRVTVVVDGDERVVEAYALDILGGDLGQTGLSEAQLGARAALADLVATVSEAATRVAQEPLVPERYRVLAGPPLDPSTLDPAGPQPTSLAWPVVPEPVDGQCTAIAGDGVAALAEALGSANELTQWTVGDRTFSLAVRPVLPHEPDCPPGG